MGGPNPISSRRGRAVSNRGWVLGSRGLSTAAGDEAKKRRDDTNIGVWACSSGEAAATASSSRKRRAYNSRGEPSSITCPSMSGQVTSGVRRGKGVASSLGREVADEAGRRRRLPAMRSGGGVGSG